MVPLGGFQMVLVGGTKMVLLKGSNMVLFGYIKMAPVGGNPVTRASHVFDCGDRNSWRTGGAKMVLLGGTKKKVLVATQRVLAALPHSWCSHWSNARAALLPNHPGQCP